MDHHAHILVEPLAPHLRSKEESQWKTKLKETEETKSSKKEKKLAFFHVDMTDKMLIFIRWFSSGKIEEISTPVFNKLNERLSVA